MVSNVTDLDNCSVPSSGEEVLKLSLHEQVCSLMLVKCKQLCSQTRDISQPAGIKTTEDKVAEFISHFQAVSVER